MTASTPTRTALPSRPSVYRSRASVELKEFFRQRESVVFTLMLPVLLLVVFGAVLDFDLDGGVSFTQYFMAGIIAAGILGASLQNMAISIATERSDGTLKSLAGTPMPRSAFFVGKVVQVLAVTVAIIVVLLLVGVVFYRIDPPRGCARSSCPTRWPPRSRRGRGSSAAWRWSWGSGASQGSCSASRRSAGRTSSFCRPPDGHRCRGPSACGAEPLPTRLGGRCEAAPRGETG
jgi:hypothetical protein